MKKSTKPSKSTPGWRPTDPRAVVALEQWLTANHPYMLDGSMGFVVDPCANFGGVLELVCEIDHRYAIEINPAYSQKLLDRVHGENLVIGSSLESENWPPEVGFIILDLPSAEGVSTAFLDMVLRMQKHYGYTSGVAVLCTTTFTRALKTLAVLKEHPPRFCLGMSFRLTTSDLSGGTGQPYDWLVWLPEPPMGKPTIYECLPRPDVPASVVAEFKALSMP